ncbi:hypothetical protein GTA08_BOTSDO01705 [Neofusicoccum parvum]|nr:hypothetical protein GTA08_BOTSDO01705 [Neofusicoccum parvum]GME35418.1 hypothetical protein GTA08_BOTSDO01705 [Neofusicoccum parvum]
MEDAIEADADYTILLKLAARPQQYLSVLLGISWAFIGLHKAVAASSLLSPDGQATLRGIASREENGIMECIENSGIADEDLCKGYRLGTDLIDSCIVTPKLGHE